MFRSMVYAENEEKFNEKFEDFENDEVIYSYQNFKHHIETLYMGRVEKWSRFKKVSLPTHGNDTTNYVVSSFKILKDKTFQHHKSYNLVDTLTVLIISLSCSYKVRLDLDPAYLQVQVHYLLTSCIYALKQKSLQVGSKKNTLNLHLQVVFDNPNSTFRLLCVTIVRPGPRAPPCHTPRTPAAPCPPGCL